MKLIKLGSTEVCSARQGHSSTWTRTALSLAMAVSFLSVQPLFADEFPPLCSKADGGQGNTSTTGINFANHQAHVGDTVEVFPSLGMVAGACQAMHATGSVYIATGFLVTFLNDVTLDPNFIYQCPTNTSPPCTPGPYSFVVTLAMVGAPVTSPGGSIGGVPKTVRALQWSFSNQVRTGDPLETLDKVDTASINIVTPCILVQKFCDLPVGKTCFGPNDAIRFRGYVTNCGDITLTNVTALDSRTGPLVLLNPANGLPLNPGNPTGPVTLAVGAFATFTNNYTPTQQEICAGNATNFVTVRGTDTSDIGGPRASVTNSTSVACPICINPCIQVTKTCPGPVIVGQQQTISGIVTNCGDITLTNIVLTDNILGAITNIAVLPPGGVVSYSRSFTATCNNNTNTVTANATSICGNPVQASATAACTVTSTPCISVTKLCTGPIVVGGIQTISGVVSNCGNITLTNVVVTDNILGGVTNIASLAPGATLAYTKTFTATCNANTNTVTATATSICGAPVQNSATAVCPVTSTPCIFVTKNCTTNLVGSSQTISGVVSNCGNITLTNIIVTDNIAGGVTNIASLAPGAFTAYSKSFTAVCGGNVNTVTAIGTSICGQNVTNSATATCVVFENPCIAVTKLCTGPVVVGAPQTISGVISNCGNVTLTNIVLTDNILGAVTNIATLPVGGTLAYSRTFTATCAGNTNTVTVTASSICGTPVQNSATAACPVTSTACIFVTKNCTTNLVGTSQTISGVVSNCGNITLTNIIVSDNILGAVTNIASLAPGASTSYSRSFTAVCGGNINTVTAIGTSTCGQNVTNSATATCVVFENPCIAVTKVCNGPILVGAIQTISGVVSNCGNVTLTNIVVTDNILGGVTNIPTLPVGGSVAYSKTFTAGCSPSTNTVTATANSICGTPVQNSATATCLSTHAPCIGVTKVCTPSIVEAGASVTFTGYVTNCGNVTLTNVQVRDSLLGNAVILTVPVLPVGAAQSYSTNYTTSTNDCGKTLTNVVTATGTDACGDHNVTNVANCSFTIDCPKICIIKEIACFDGTNGLGADVCTTFGKLATGVQGDTQNPAFCYRITVTNCGLVALTNVTVIDDKYGDLTSHFFANPSVVFPPGGTITFTFKAELDGASLPNHISVVTNTVVTRGQGANSGSVVTAQDIAVARIIPAGIVCEQLYIVDNGTLTNCVKLSLTDGPTHTVVTYIRLRNTGLADLLNIQVTNDVANPCDVDRIVASLPAGSTVLIALCTNTAYACDSTASTITVTASQYAMTNVSQLCAKDINGKVIVVRSECPGCIECTVPNACRVTGGGRQDDPIVYPPNVRYVTHGGQVGAPVGNRVCEVTTNFFLGNPCIHGRWTHVRHVQGGLEGNFHARFYDTLDCACLDTNVTSVVTNVPGVNGNPSQTYANLVYGEGTTVNGICNPDDHKVAGPQPRPAPANKIVFTGVGDWADPNGRRASRATLFRVDIEDRSEPGGSHPKGGVAPPDRYRIRIWVLTDAELAQLNGAGPDRYLLNFRNAISACNGLNVQDGASVPNGTAAFGVRAPDVDDGGELERGNHQIHPAIKNCDPFNPTGPGLANP